MQKRHESLQSLSLPLKGTHFYLARNEDGAAQIQRICKHSRHFDQIVSNSVCRAFAVSIKVGLSCN